MRTLLDRYASGDHDAVVATVAAAPRARAQAFRGALVSAGHGWAYAAGPEQLARRLFVAAAFALEVESARAERGDWTSYGGNCAGRCVAEWACAMLRARGDADEAERIWQLAAIALAGGVRDWTFLVSPLTPPTPRTPESGHLRHVIARLPGEPRLRLARAMAIASRYDIGYEMDAPRAGERTRPAAPFTIVVLNGPVSPLSDRRRAQLAYAMEQLSALTDDPVVGAEAALRLGYLYWRSENYEAALDAERAAADAMADPALRYVAYFLAAQAAQALGELIEAESLYGRALEARPHSQSATLGLSALRFLRGDAAGAYDLLERSRIERPNDDDPWRMFLYGDFPRLQGLIRELRARLTP